MPFALMAASSIAGLTVGIVLGIVLCRRAILKLAGPEIRKLERKRHEDMDRWRDEVIRRGAND